MKIYELFDNPITDILWRNGSYESDQAVFNINDDTYVVTFQPMQLSRKLIDRYDIPVDLPEHRLVARGYDIDFGLLIDKNRGVLSYDLMNTGNAIQVLSTVVDIIKTYIQDTTYEFIRFTSANDEPSRVKLYRAMVNKFSKEANLQTFERPYASKVWDQTMWIILTD